jgi:hypothetical protein
MDSSRGHDPRSVQVRCRGSARDARNDRGSQRWRRLAARLHAGRSSCGYATQLRDPASQPPSSAVAGARREHRQPFTARDCEVEHHGQRRGPGACREWSASAARPRLDARHARSAPTRRRTVIKEPRHPYWVARCQRLTQRTRSVKSATRGICTRHALAEAAARVDDGTNVAPCCGGRFQTWLIRERRPVR